ncbi:MAG: hypothetical protein JGK17_21110 [Microcoleus sp. PH2017_10_PVI_O_A]|uniref:hypothetical protein n=1 Tax=unclassified Microcoleus TaxID=2642155 RepID=UPI001DC89493|nr:MULTISPECIES: hypothetical protein [unclassified Microcoleus]TAE80595.1 MAG: hypothetical protein EAZ83_18110 [Oscillatoriales cyanobacterium]MCC3408038.1 hypothetical protein [Microcoleus sp. PH2017_10_PVI_O_A]MCC3462159.1 hypothetical protein [Microcoleus sp. PH2017_11_PCY_U_A]MCC3480591.1 hypothetical protein [Microcoleus sp. PH2017_12_PCY_D_A]MCC3530503.1 hypothetical protein [Microcoleus sp. PH2017_21_RUC_O_A]
MKKQSILGILLSCTVLGTGYLTKPQTVNAAPASLFTPIIREVKNQIPRGWVMRLPSSVNISNTKLYPEVITTIPGEFAVFLNSQPNCMTRSCYFGVIAVAKNSEYANSLRSKHIFSKTYLPRVRAIRQRDYQTRTESEQRLLNSLDMAVLERTPITLKPGIQGVFIVQNGGGASTPPSLHVLWKQDGLNYRASIKGGFDYDRSAVIQSQKSALINLAISMAKESPIKSAN